jgi:ATP phosphoribosyltransferase regulatory subunit
VRGGVSAAREAELLGVLQAKDKPGLAALAAGLDGDTRRALVLLPDLYGGRETLERALQELPPYPELRQALGELATLVDANGGAVSVDLSDLRGYHYHSGVLFAAYASGHPTALALGGRYDEVGKAFGRARPATGFSMDLREVARVVPRPAERGGVLAPWGDEPALLRAIDRLRAAGEVVVVELPGHEAARAELGCDRQLVRRGDAWATVALE